MYYHNIAYLSQTTFIFLIYLLKTNLKCKDGNTLYKYIDNIVDYNVLTHWSLKYIIPNSVYFKTQAEIE